MAYLRGSDIKVSCECGLRYTISHGLSKPVIKVLRKEMNNGKQVL